MPPLIGLLCVCLIEITEPDAFQYPFFQLFLLPTDLPGLPQVRIAKGVEPLRLQDLVPQPIAPLRLQRHGGAVVQTVIGLLLDRCHVLAKDYDRAGGLGVLSLAFELFGADQHLVDHIADLPRPNGADCARGPAQLQGSGLDTGDATETAVVEVGRSGLDLGRAADQTEQVGPRLIRLDAGDEAVTVGDKAVAADGEIVVHDAS